MWFISTFISVGIVVVVLAFLLWQASPFVAEQQVTMGWLLIIFLFLISAAKLERKNEVRNT